MIRIGNLTEATRFIQHELASRGKEETRTEKVIADRTDQFPIYHTRIWTLDGPATELFHVKFAKQGYRLKPTDKLSERAKELDEKLRHAIREFGQGNEELNGLNEDVIYELLDYTQQDIDVFFLTVMQDGVVYSCSILDFYQFVMRYDTFFKFPKSRVPVCEVPIGWMKKWANVSVAFPSLAD